MKWVNSLAMLVCNAVNKMLHQCCQDTVDFVKDLISNSSVKPANTQDLLVNNLLDSLASRTEPGSDTTDLWVNMLGSSANNSRSSLLRNCWVNSSATCVASTEITAVLVSLVSLDVQATMLVNIRMHPTELTVKNLDHLVSFHLLKNEKNFNVITRAHELNLFSCTNLDYLATMERAVVFQTLTMEFLMDLMLTVLNQHQRTFLFHSSNPVPLCSVFQCRTCISRHPVGDQNNLQIFIEF